MTFLAAIARAVAPAVLAPLAGKLLGGNSEPKQQQGSGGIFF